MVPAADGSERWDQGLRGDREEKRERRRKERKMKRKRQREEV